MYVRASFHRLLTLTRWKELNSWSWYTTLLYEFSLKEEICFPASLCRDVKGSHLPLWITSSIINGWQSFFKAISNSSNFFFFLLELTIVNFYCLQLKHPSYCLPNLSNIALLSLPRLASTLSPPSCYNERNVPSPVDKPCLHWVLEPTSFQKF